MSHKLSQQNFNTQLKALLSCFGKLPTENNLPGTLSTSEGNGPSICTPAHNSKAAFAAEAKKAPSNIEQPNPPADDVHCSHSPLKSRFEASSCPAVSSKPRRPHEGYLAGIGDQSYRRDEMICSKMPAAVTVFNQCGGVVHQNSASIHYMGDRVNCKKSCSITNVLALVFQLEPEKHERMMYDINRENAGRWRGIVRVPCSLSGAGPDAHAPVLAQKTKLVSDSGSMAHVVVMDTADRNSRSVSYSLTAPRAQVRMTSSLDVQSRRPCYNLSASTQHHAPGQPPQISARDLTSGKADFLPNFRSCFATAAAQRMVSESQTDRTEESGHWRVDNKVVTVRTSRASRSGSPLAALALLPSQPLDQALSEGAGKACLGTPNHAVFSKSSFTSNSELTFPLTAANTMTEATPLETRGTCALVQGKPSHDASTSPTVRLAPCTSTGSVTATSFIKCQMPSSCPPAWTPPCHHQPGPAVTANNIRDLDPILTSAPEPGCAFGATAAGGHLTDGDVCSSGDALGDATPNTGAAAAAVFVGEGHTTQSSLTWDTGNDPLATSTFGLALSRHAEAAPVPTPNFAVPAALDGSVGGVHASLSSAQAASALAASPGAGSVGDDGGGSGGGDSHTSCGAHCYKERAIDMGSGRQLSVSPRNLNPDNQTRTGSWLTPRMCAGALNLAGSYSGGIGGSGGSASMPSRVPSSVGSVQNSPHSRALVFASSLRNAPTATQILAEGSRRGGLQYPRVSARCSGHDASPAGTAAAAAADSGPGSGSKDFVRRLSSMDVPSQHVRIARPARSSLSSRNLIAVTRPQPDSHDAEQPTPSQNEINEITTHGATPLMNGGLACMATSVPIPRAGFGEQKVGSPRRVPSLSRLLRTISIGRTGFLEVAAGFSPLPEAETPVASVGVTATADATAPTASDVSYAASINTITELAAVSSKKPEVTGTPTVVMTAAAVDAITGCSASIRLVKEPSDCGNIVHGGDGRGATAAERWHKDKVSMEKHQHQHLRHQHLQQVLLPKSHSNGPLCLAPRSLYQPPPPPSLLRPRPSDGAAAMCPVSTHVQEHCWHEIWALRAVDPITGEDVVIMSQHDVSAKVIAERHLALVMEAEHRLLEQLFPKHILTHVTEEWIAEAEKADEKAAGNNRGHCGSPQQAGAGPVECGTSAVKNTTGAEAISAAALVNNPRAVSSAEWRPVVRDCNALATWHPQVTLLFADIKGFTPMCKQVTPREVMAMLNDLFSRFDAMLDKFGVFKVETIGDCYFVAGGLIREDEDGMAAVRDGDSRIDPLHANKVFMFAKAMLSAALEVPMPSTGEPVQIRIGISSGPVVSGVVGTRMPRFCLFGDTVNTTSRMESTGQPGAIHASESAYSLLKSESWEPTGGIEVKGKGLMQTFVWRPTMEAIGTSAVRQLPLASSASAAAAAAAALKAQHNDVTGLPSSTNGGGGTSSALLRYTIASGSRAVRTADDSRSRAASSVIVAEAASAATLAAAIAATATTSDATCGANTIPDACQTVDGIHTKIAAAAAAAVDCCNEDSDPLVSMLLSHVD